ncbi:phospholipid-binding protein MlaC [Malikia sp.]|uniref:MlaC/ttg2D family ABC transporter substrate-binding protein n=1 Tax=Malikia sp. TaxID=2070706 RepID=UPI00260F452D|nr:ABC transporter substrate-binding protein [Malikia sp.]MDD2729198.1 ABC transporter substrate-binding protein [Malikia sp.]
MSIVIDRRAALGWVAAFSLVSLAGTTAAQASEGPEVLIQRVAAELIEAVKSDAALRNGDTGRVIALVDSRLMPHVNFRRMTASAVGRFWRQASLEQKQKLQDEFKTLLVRTYSGALSQVKDQTLVVKPLRANPGDTEVIVRSELRTPGKDPVQLDYRVEKTDAGWKVYDLNVLGIWLVETYRGQFSQEINAKGIDGLIASLAQRNRSNAAEKPPAALAGGKG